MTHYVIDGYNLLFYLFPGDNIQGEREELIAFLSPYTKKAKITVVFDSMHSEDFHDRGHKRDVEVVYTEHGKTADDEIVEWIEHIPKGVTVVTSDKGIARKVKDFGASWINCPTFVGWLLKNEEPRTEETTPKFSKREFERWRKIFEERC